MKLPPPSIPILGAGSRQPTRQEISDAAKRTAESLRKVAVQPQVVDSDRPFLLMCALGWEEFGRQIMQEVH